MEPSGPSANSKGKQDRKDDYSGKKKAHCKKNLLLSSHARQVVYLGSTSPSSVHDKTLSGKSHLSLPADVVVLQDAGFQGYATQVPKPPNPAKSHGDGRCSGTRRPSTKLLAARVSVEHTIAGAERCRIVADMPKFPHLTAVTAHSWFSGVGNLKFL